MKKVIAFGGSNSKNSINKQLASYTANKVQNVQADIIDLNDYELPLYGIDFESANGIPENAKKLSNLIESADGLVISLPEHNGSYSSVFKNTMDWMSRIDVNVWKNKPMLLLATSPGARGGATVLQAAKTSFPYLGGNIVADFAFPGFYDNFSGDKISNDELSEELNSKIQIFEQEVKNK